MTISGSVDELHIAGPMNSTAMAVPAATNRLACQGFHRSGSLATISKQRCRAVDQPCPSGVPGDLCRAAVRVCEAAEDTRCEAAVYENPAVPIATLPGNEVVLVASTESTARVPAECLPSPREAGRGR